MSVSTLQVCPDPFDPERLRISHDFTDISVGQAAAEIPVRKPSKEWWIRTNPDPTYQLDTGVIELKDGSKEIFLVDPPLRPALAGESTFGPRRLITAINRQGVVFLWPLRLPAPDGRLDPWSRSALEAAELAKTRWTRVTSNMAVGKYDVFTTEAVIPEPAWPKESFRELLHRAFKDRYIAGMDHPKLRELRGEV